MRATGIRRSVLAGAVASAAVLALPPVSAAAATANTNPATSTLFQVPVRYVAGCGLAVWTCVPQLTTVTPTAAPNAPGEVTFATEPPPPGVWCLDVSVRWLNLTSGAAGTTVLRRVTPDHSRPVAPEDWCRYASATAATGSGTVTATATVDMPGGYLITITPGVGVFPVP
ncbi:hypothetical protein [Rhodococcus kronopolitis]|uniref:Secreted protein n=1 Tax=Rhodococcus kronopolitis TaxID=1460226 RepID=A0ABV9FQN3_9NOCA